VRVHDLVPRLDIELLDGAASADAGVVDEHVERPEAADDLANGARHPFLVADAELADCRLVLAGIAAGDGNGRTRGAQPSRHHEPQPAVAAGDERDAVGQREHAVRLAS
jgi:hypothetical protein